MSSVGDPYPNSDHQQLEAEVWAAPVPKKSKKKKGKKYANTFIPGEDDETPFAQQAITSTSPPAPYPLAQFHGVDLNEDDFPPDRLAIESSPPPATCPPLVELEDEATAVEENHASPKLVAAPWPVATSPRPASAALAPTTFSPPPRQTTSYGSPGQQSGLKSYRPTSSTASQAAQRRESFQSHAPPRQHFVEPAAPPHKAQPHFYGLPDLGWNFGLKREQNVGKAAGSEGYCCCFDSFADAGDAVSANKAKDALLVGSEGGLEVFRVLPNKFEVVGRLEGLRGSVVGAKILPHVELFDALQPVRPLLAVIIHGVIIDDGDRGGDHALREPSRYCQTTVEVYSLQTQEHIATLYRSLPVAVEQPSFSRASSLPEPVGDLRVSAKGRFVVLASGKSGEMWIFSNVVTPSSPEPHYRCLGKFWTSLQIPLDGPTSRPQSASETSQTFDEPKHTPGLPLFSLSQRWLAYVPPNTSSHVSIQGSPLVSDSSPNPPGLASAVSPPQPPVTCDIVGVDAEDAWSRLTRQAAQGVVKYSQRGIDLGWQGWKELTNPTPQPAHGRSSSREQDGLFPPTKALPDDPTIAHKDPAIVSIIDLEALLEAEEVKPKYPPAPLTTFALPQGCNFLSSSTSGLRLLAVSRKGEISTVWDLTQSFHGLLRPRRASGENSTRSGPCVKQIHRIPRSSQSVVVDCAWSRDDEHLALLTTHGTIHLHEVPARSRSRKRKRRTTDVTSVAEKAQATVSVQHGLSPPSSNGGFLGSLKTGWQNVSTQVNSIRSQNPVSSLGIPMSFAGFKEATANASHAGGRVIAKGLSQGLTAAKGGASDYWHSEDNKIRHKALLDLTNPIGSMRWMKRQSDIYLAIVCGGTVHLHPVSRIERRKGDAMVSGLKQDRYGQKHFALPSIRTRGSGNVANGMNRKSKEVESCAQAGPHGFWSLRASPNKNGDGRGTSDQPPSVVNEVETNPPYCPFHVDSRVDIFSIEDAVHGSQFNYMKSPTYDGAPFRMHGHGPDEADSNWIFGEPLPPSTKMNTHDSLDIHHDLDSESEAEIDLAQQMESRLTIRTMDGDGGEEIQINTRITRAMLEDEDYEVENFDDDGSEL